MNVEETWGFWLAFGPSAAIMNHRVTSFPA